MFVSQTVMGYLDRCDADYTVVTHRHSATSAQTAREAHISPRDLAKAVLLHDDADFLLAVVPAMRMVNPWAIEDLLGEPQIMMAEENDLPFVFRDCERGAVPALGTAFGVKTIVDDEVLERRNIYFEGGDHEHLIHMRGRDFARLMLGQPHGHIAF